MIIQVTNSITTDFLIFYHYPYLYHSLGDKHAKANHTIPMEIAAKISSKIRNGEIFRAFIVLPMFPEGERN